MAVLAGTTQLSEAGDMLRGSFISYTPTANATLTATAGSVGTHLTLKVLTSGTSSFTLTFGTGFKATATLATGTSSGKVFQMEFVSDGTTWNEASRTTAM